jgi:hypothetical protein
LLGNAEKVRVVTGLEVEPRVVRGESEVGTVDFCLVDEEAKRKIDEWLAQAQVVDKSDGGKA